MYRLIISSKTDKVDGSEGNSMEEKMKLKLEDRGKHRLKSDDSLDKINGRGNNNADTGNCYW